MENNIKEHINKLYKKRLKEKIDNEIELLKSESVITLNAKDEKKLRNEIRDKIDKSLQEEFECTTWLQKILSHDMRGSYFPRSIAENDLFQLLTLDVLYKLNFKSACDANHPIIIDLLNDLKIQEYSINKIIEMAKAYETEPLEYYLLFQEELENNSFGLQGVLEKVDTLSQDSSHGSIVSHPAKMTNPECKYPKIFRTSNMLPDGFIRTGNSDTIFDIHIDAKYLKIYKFLTLEYKNKLLLEYIKGKDTLPFKEVFAVSEDRAQDWIKNFSACIENEDMRTNQHVRQVYFPVKDKYHLLSILTPSGLVFSLKKKIDTMNDRSPATYSGKKLKKDKKYSEIGFSTIPNLTITQHGGEHPKNISGLNNKYQSYYLLSSIPPTLQRSILRFPKHNFFKESLHDYEYRDIFHALHKLFRTDYNNHSIREGRDYRIQSLIDLIIDRMWAVRAVCTEQYQPENSRLKPHQKLWLCDEFIQIREEEDDWLDILCKEVAAWIIRTYERLLGKNAYKLGEAERVHIYKIVSENREALR